MEFWSKSPYVQKPLGKRDKRDGNVKMDLKQIYWCAVGWTHLIQVMNQWDLF